jgi:DNA polymerase-3 subunit gamma/tau
MGYQVLARKYRPQRFADVAGQDHVTRTLMNALTQNRIAHGYIFSGHRGIGKTTIARILAMALNCREKVGSPERPTAEPCLKCTSCREISSGGSSESGNEAMQSFDFIEIDAASNRGIDDVRSIRAEATVQPARDRYKIFLLDEAHQITEAAFNAILKTLEEPPEWAIFMLATTQPEDIPQTIRSRCQHFSFHAVKFEDILSQLKMIAEHEEIEAEEGALALLAEAGDGSMRDALSIMDQAIASAPVEAGRPKLSVEQIRELMGSVPNAVFERLLEAVAAGKSAELMEQLNLLLNAGHNASSLARQMARYLRNTLMAKIGGEQTELLQISADERARAARTAMLFTEDELTRNLQIVLRTFDELNYRQEQRFHLELGLLKLIQAQRLLPIEELLSGVAAGGGLRSGAPSSPSARPASPAIRPPSAPVRPAAPAPKPAPAAATPLSPFGPMGGGWSSGPKLDSSPKPATTARPVATMAAPAPAAVSAPAPVSPFQGSTPFAAGASQPAATAAPLTEGALARAPQAAASASTLPSIESIREAISTALAKAGHESASELLGTGTWTLEGSTLRIEVPGMGKKMLGLTINAAAEKIIRQELSRLGGPTRFMVLPGDKSVQRAAPSATPLAGSIQEAAMANPLVQRAKEIFKAEVRSVVDLRQK